MRWYIIIYNFQQFWSKILSLPYNSYPSPDSAKAVRRSYRRLEGKERFFDSIIHLGCALQRSARTRDENWTHILESGDAVRSDFIWNTALQPFNVYRKREKERIRYARVVGPRELLKSPRQSFCSSSRADVTLLPALYSENGHSARPSYIQHAENLKRSRQDGEDNDLPSFSPSALRQTKIQLLIYMPSYSRAPNDPPPPWRIAVIRISLDGNFKKGFTFNGEGETRFIDILTAKSWFNKIYHALRSNLIVALLSLVNCHVSLSGYCILCEIIYFDII